jgi:hypothetical protein
MQRRITVRRGESKKGHLFGREEMSGGAAEQIKCNLTISVS